MADQGKPELFELNNGTIRVTITNYGTTITSLFVPDKQVMLFLDSTLLSHISRLSDVLGLLSSEQPRCPQLYLYSTADRVIPPEAVESFLEKQRRDGHEVRACNFISTLQVDHFRNDPNLYTSQFTKFFEDSAQL